MTDIAIRVENLSKRYRIGARLNPHATLRDAIAGAFTRWNVGKLKRSNLPTFQPSNEFWALKDVSFEVKRGEVLGVIGRNGAGKSTLLKILSRITKPTSGRAEIHGRVGSLLEVGTGFHPELTGRENIYLNGAILGMRRREIARKFDEMVAFAEVEQFIDTPVKHYSSGMYVRLAFAVAAHLEPEILLVDEVLAVGDAAFQRKCLGKMEDLGHVGRTVLFVSHNTPFVLRLCKQAILLDQGRLLAQGDSHAVTGAYLRHDSPRTSVREWSTLAVAPGDSVARLLAVRVLNSARVVTDTVDIREALFIEVVYRNMQSRVRPTALVQLYNEQGVCLFASNDFSSPEWSTFDSSHSTVQSTCQIPANFLAEGQHFVLVAVATYNPNEVHAIEHNAVSFCVIDNSAGDGVRGPYTGAHWPGVVRPALKWDILHSDPSTKSNLE